jgi:hypothetical protein
MDFLKSADELYSISPNTPDKECELGIGSRRTAVMLVSSDRAGSLLNHELLHRMQF